jgi:hypothetical protein
MKENNNNEYFLILFDDSKWMMKHIIIKILEKFVDL